MSIEVEPKGPVASFAAATKIARSERARRFRQRGRRRRVSPNERSRTGADGGLLHAHRGRPVLLRPNRSDNASRHYAMGRTPRLEHHGNPTDLVERGITEILRADQRKRRRRCAISAETIRNPPMYDSPFTGIVSPTRCENSRARPATHSSTKISERDCKNRINRTNVLRSEENHHAMASEHVGAER